jgi:hypothetical protein
MSDASTVPGSERPEPLLEALLRVGPRLVERSRRQAEFAAVVVHGLRRLGAPSRGASAPPADLATVEPPTPPRREPTVLDHIGPAAEVVDPAADPPRAAPTATEAPAEDELPIDGYDSLAASQVVPRLVTLSGDELRAVQRYEQAGRHRQTILNRVGQLLTDR